MFKKILAVLLLTCTHITVFPMCNPCTLTEVAGSPFTSSDPVSPTFSSRCNFFASPSTVYTIDPNNCTLGPNTIALGVGGAITVAFSPDGNCLAVGDLSGGVTVFMINADCTLSKVLGSPFPTGSGAAISSVAFSADSGCLVTTNNPPSNTVSLFSVDPTTCALSLVTTTASGGLFPQNAVFSPNGNCVIVSNRGTGVSSNTNIAIFSVTKDGFGNCTGLMAPPTTVTAGLSAPVRVAVNPQGTCLAVADSLNGLVLYTFNQSNCTATFNTQLFTGTRTSSVEFSPLGICLAVVRSVDDVFDNTVTMIQMVNCTPGSSTDYLLGTKITGIAFSPTGRCFAVTNDVSNTISMFSTNIVTTPTIIQALGQCDGTVIVSGTANPNVIINIYADGNLVIPVGTGMSDASGNFTITTVPLSTGMHTLVAIATNPATTCTSDPSAPVIVSVASLATPMITNVAANCFQRVTVLGTASPSVPVTLLVDGVPVAFGMSNSQGIFVFANLAVTAGFHCFTAETAQPGCTAISLPFCITISFPGPCPSLANPNSAFGGHCNVTC